MRRGVPGTRLLATPPRTSISLLPPRLHTRRDRSNCEGTGAPAPGARNLRLKTQPGTRTARRRHDIFHAPSTRPPSGALQPQGIDGHMRVPKTPHRGGRCTRSVRNHHAHTRAGRAAGGDAASCPRGPRDCKGRWSMSLTGRAPPAACHAGERPATDPRARGLQTSALAHALNRQGHRASRARAGG